MFIYKVVEYDKVAEYYMERAKEEPSLQETFCLCKGSVAFFAERIPCSETENLIV